MVDEADAPKQSQLADELDERNALTIKRTKRVQTREQLVGWTTIAANLAVPITLGIAAFGLWNQSHQDRSDASARQIELFYSENLGRAQSVLLSLWDGADLAVLRSPQSRQFINLFVEKTIATSPIERKAVVSAIVNLSSYFDRVEACIEAKRCDETELLDQLGQYGRDFFCIYEGQIETIRQDSLLLSLGAGLKQFSIQAGGCES